MRVGSAGSLKHYHLNSFHRSHRQNGFPRGVARKIAAVKNGGRVGEQYMLTQEEKEKFHNDGYVHLKGVMTDGELVEVIDPVYKKLTSGEIHIEGNDLCDMSGAKDRTPDEFTVYNVMLPRKYYPLWQNSLFEKRCQSIADQLCDGGMGIDYDQILAKKPNSPDAIFAWHQDMAYWPPTKADPATATCWLAVDDSTVENGCMRFIPGSHREADLRKHAPVGKTRADSHALYTTVDDQVDNIMEVPINRGDITVHNERVAHGSGPNNSDNWRRAYVLAFRKLDCISEERSIGFTHSHNDDTSWDVFRQHGL